MEQKNLSYSEALIAMQSNFKVRHSSWEDSRYLNKDSIVSVAESMSNDWVIDPDPYDQELEDLKYWVFDELEFNKDRQSRYYSMENVRSYFDLWLIVENNLVNSRKQVSCDEYYKRLLEFVKENELLK